MNRFQPLGSLYKPWWTSDMETTAVWGVLGGVCSQFQQEKEEKGQSG